MTADPGTPHPTPLGRPSLGGGAGHPHAPSSPGPPRAATADLGPADPPTLGERWIPALFLPILGRGVGWGDASRVPGNILGAESDFPWAEQQVLVGLQEGVCPQSLCLPVCEQLRTAVVGTRLKCRNMPGPTQLPEGGPVGSQCPEGRDGLQPRFIYVPHRFRGGGQSTPRNNSLPLGPTSSLVPAELQLWMRANRAAGRHWAPQGRRWLRTMAPRGARAPALSLAVPTELQRSWKQQKMGWAAPMLSGSVASQELAQVLVTTGLSLKGNSGGRAGVRARSPRPGHPSLRPSPALPAPSQDTLTDHRPGSHPAPAGACSTALRWGLGAPGPRRTCLYRHQRSLAGYFVGFAVGNVLAQRKGRGLLTGDAT